MGRLKVYWTGARYFAKTGHVLGRQTVPQDTAGKAPKEVPVFSSRALQQVVLGCCGRGKRRLAGRVPPRWRKTQNCPITHGTKKNPNPVCTLFLSSPPLDFPPFGPSFSSPTPAPPLSLSLQNNTFSPYNFLSLPFRPSRLLAQLFKMAEEVSWIAAASSALCAAVVFGPSLLRREGGKHPASPRGCWVVLFARLFSLLLVPHDSDDESGAASPVPMSLSWRETLRLMYSRDDG